MEFNEIVSLPQTAAKPPATRRHTSSAEQQQWIERWQRSGLNPQLFCQQHGLNPKTFSNWKTKHTSSLNKATTKTSDRSTTPSPLIHRFNVHLPNGIQLALGIEDASLATLISLTQALAAWK